MGSNGKKIRDRDHALTWHLPPHLTPCDNLTVESSRAGFLRAAEVHLDRLVEQQLEEEGVEDPSRWAACLVKLAWQAAKCLSPVAMTAYGTIDPRQYIKVKRVVDGGDSTNSTVIQGVVFRKTLAHKRMRTSITQAKVLILAGALEYQPSESNLQQFDALLSEEQAYLQATVERIASYSPDILLVERSVARYAQELLMDKDITLVLNVKRELLERVSRCTGAEVLSSVSQLSSHALGFCKEFGVENTSVSAHIPPNPTQLAQASTAPTSTSALVSSSPRAALDAEQGHFIADTTALQKSAATARIGRNSLLLFKGCARLMGCTILLKGCSIAELTKVKRIAAFAAYAAYWNLLEAEVLGSQLASAAAAEAAVPQSLVEAAEPSSEALTNHSQGGGLGAFWEALAAACAEASAHEAALARRGQLILSPSPHVVYQGGSENQAEKHRRNRASDHPPSLQHGPKTAAESSQATMPAMRRSSVLQKDVHLIKDLLLSEISSASDPWVVPADADQATVTVTGPAAAVQETLSRDTAPSIRVSLTEKEKRHETLVQLDPLSAAAEEVKQRLSHVSIDGSSEAEADSTSTAASTGGAVVVQDKSMTEVSSPISTFSKLQRGITADNISSKAGSIYTGQQLWVSISCKNPAKGILCEPPHTHCMQFYANQDMPLAEFLAAATPAHRKCAHPACGDGAMLHLRSFMHGDGMLTLSSVKLPTGQELPGKGNGQVWVWLRPLGQNAEVQRNVRRVPLSTAAACISFAHLLVLLLDGRFLSFGGQSLQRDYVRYLGSGRTVLCLHHSAIASNSVCLPDPQVALVPKHEVAWLLEEVKALTEEADEAFSAIHYALVQQLQPLEDKEPGSVQSWVTNLAETQAAFMELAAKAALETYSLQEGPGKPEVLASSVWDVNKLRRLLAYEVLQWATALHEGTPVSRAEPPQAMATSLDSCSRLSRQGSLDGGPTDAEQASTAAHSAATPASEIGAAVGSSQADQRQESSEGTAAPPTAQLGASVGLPPLPPEARSRMPFAEEQSQGGAQSMQEHKKGGSSFHSRNWSFEQQCNSQAAGFSGFAHANYAPSLQDGGPMMDADIAVSGQGDGQTPSHQAEQPPPIPIGLVARYVALFDQGKSKGEPSSPLNAQQRTFDWVQHASPSSSRVRSTPSSAVGSPRIRNGSQQSLAKQSQQAGQQACVSDMDDDDVAYHIGDMRSGSGDLGGLAENVRYRVRPSMLIDLANPDPGVERLASVLSPRSRFEDCEPADDSQHSALHQLANRFGRLSLYRSLSELQSEHRAELAAHHSASAKLDDRIPNFQKQAGPSAILPEDVPSNPDGGATKAAETAALVSAEGLQPQISSMSVSHFEEWGDLLLPRGSGPTYPLAISKDTSGKGWEAQDAPLRPPGRASKLDTAPLLLPASSPAMPDAAQVPETAERPAENDQPINASASVMLSSMPVTDSATAPLQHIHRPQTSTSPPLASAGETELQEPAPICTALPPDVIVPKQPSKLKQLFSKLRLEPTLESLRPSAGKVELNGRSLLPPGLEDVYVTIFDEEPTSVVAYFLSTRVYNHYLRDALSSIMSGETFGRANPTPVQSTDPAQMYPNDSGQSGVSGLQKAHASEAQPRAHASSDQMPQSDSSASWQVLFSEQRLDCQLSIEDMSPGMPFGRTKFQVVAYYAPQFSELRRRCVVGGEDAFLAAISRCRKWASQGGKSNVYFAKTRDDRFIVKQLSKSEKQSFLEFAPDYFRYVSTALHKGQDTCLAKILGVFQVTVKYANASVHPFGATAGNKDGVMDILIMENIFYGRSIARIYDLKGSERDRYAADNPAMAGVVLLDENLKEVNLSSPTLVTPEAYAKLQRALWSDTAFLSSLGVMDYSLLVGIDKQGKELVVGVIDFIRQYTWDKQVETWVKKSGILGGAGKDPTVISPKQYSRRFRVAISGYFTVVPSQQQPPAPLDPDAV